MTMEEYWESNPPIEVPDDVLALWAEQDIMEREMEEEYWRDISNEIDYLMEMEEYFDNL